MVMHKDTWTQENKSLCSKMVRNNKQKSEMYQKMLACQGLLVEYACYIGLKDKLKISKETTITEQVRIKENKLLIRI